MSAAITTTGTPNSAVHPGYDNASKHKPATNGEAALPVDTQRATVPGGQNAVPDGGGEYYENSHGDSVQISDTARSMSQQTNKAGSKSGEANSSPAQSLFTQAGRAETAQRYDQMFADLLANHDEDEALKLFDEFMRSEGYETKDIMEIDFAAPVIQKTPPGNSNLYSHSYLNASVVDGKEYIMASTWATYSNGNVTYHKKASDSFDIAADATSVQNGKSIYGMLLDEEGYESLNNDLLNKIDKLMQDASANGNLIDSTATKEEFRNANQAAAEWFENNITGELTLESRVKIPDSKMDSANDASGERWAYMDDKGALQMFSLDEIKARLQNTGEAPKSDRTDMLRAFHDLMKRLQS